MHFPLLYIALLDTRSPWMLSAWILFLVVLLFSGAFLNLMGFAGNWMMLGAAVLNRFLVDPELAVGYNSGLLVALLLLALLGEGLEFFAGVLGAGKAGGSRRGMVLSVVGGMAGSLFGFGLGNAVFPVLGGIAGILFFGGIGAFVGAVLGETWKGSGRRKALEIGQGAFWGRIMGTLAKTLVGTLMLLTALGGLFL